MKSHGFRKLFWQFFECKTKSVKEYVKLSKKNKTIGSTFFTPILHNVFKRLLFEFHIDRIFINYFFKHHVYQIRRSWHNGCWKLYLWQYTEKFDIPTDSALLTTHQNLYVYDIFKLIYSSIIFKMSIKVMTTHMSLYTVRYVWRSQDITKLQTTRLRSITGHPIIPFPYCALHWSIGAWSVTRKS